jgi:hypothetical protein
MEVATEALIHNLTKPGVELRNQGRRQRLGSYTPWMERVDALDLGCCCSDGDEETPAQAC